MKGKYLLLLFLVVLVSSCGNNKPTPEQKELSERYIKKLVDAKVNIYGGELTEEKKKKKKVDAYPGANFDKYAESYLEDALRAGLDIKGVNIVDVKDCQIGDGWVTGKRIGRAYK